MQKNGGFLQAGLPGKNPMADFGKICFAWNRPESLRISPAINGRKPICPIGIGFRCFTVRIINNEVQFQLER
jgi:hypothetical protein